MQELSLAPLNPTNQLRTHLLQKLDLVEVSHPESLVRYFPWNQLRMVTANVSAAHKEVGDFRLMSLDIEL